MIPIVGSLVAFVVALLVGGLAIYIAASIVVDASSYTHAVFTAAFGALAWALTAWIPLFGPILALLAWIWVINRRYPGGWIDAAVIGGLAWLSALVILVVLNAVFSLGVGAFGVPGV